MKKLFKEMLRNSAVGICTAMIIFCIAGVIFDIVSDGNISLTNYSFTKMVIGCIIVGIGFGVPAVVYESEKLPMATMVLVHMGIGSVVYTITAFYVGWVKCADFFQSVTVVIIQLAAAFGVWLIFMFYYKNEAKKLNGKLQEIKD